MENPRDALIAAIACPTCDKPLRLDDQARSECCGQLTSWTANKTILTYDALPRADSEMQARDRQAKGYLEHAKFPTQIARLKEFIQLARVSGLPVLDLGCGPGPSTQLLLKSGFRVLAIDLSKESLKLNVEACRDHERGSLFVHADLNRVRFVKHSVGGLMMADFVQHLGDLSKQRTFVHRVFEALTPGGWFYLSVFNLNIKNWLRGDIEGSFADGQIPYHRITPREAASLLPANATIHGAYPMNIFHSARADRVASRLPFARWISRMTVIYGRKSLPVGSL